MKNLQQYFTMIILCSFSLFYSLSVYATDPPINEQKLISDVKKVEQVNINQASAEELAKNLNGIGLNKAKKIVEYREKFGPFVVIEQLKEVSGIGQSILDANVGKLTL